MRDRTIIVWFASPNVTHYPPIDRLIDYQSNPIELGIVEKILLKGEGKAESTCLRTMTDVPIRAAMWSEVGGRSCINKAVCLPFPARLIAHSVASKASWHESVLGKVNFHYRPVQSWPTYILDVASDAFPLWFIQNSFWTSMVIVADWIRKM